MSDPFALFREQCERLIKSRVREPAGYRFEVPPRREFGQLSCNVAFQLTRLRKNHPPHIARDIVAGMDVSAAPLVRDVQVAGPGFINFYVDPRAYARLVLDSIRADGELYGRGEPALEQRLLIAHTFAAPIGPWHVGHTRKAVLGDTLARLFRFVGYPVEVQTTSDDTGMQVADLICGLRRFGYLSTDGTLQAEPGRKLDHLFGEVYAGLNEILDEEPELRATIESAPGSDEAQDAADRLEEIADIKAQLDALQRDLASGAYRDVIHAGLQAQLATAWRLGVYYDVVIWMRDMAHAGLIEEALSHLSRTPAVRIAAEGPYKGCLVIDLGRRARRGKPSGDGDEVVLVRSDGMPTPTGTLIAYHLWASGLAQNDMRYEIDTIQPNRQPLWTSSPHGNSRERVIPTGIVGVVDAAQIYTQQVVAAALNMTGHGDNALRSLVCGRVSVRSEGEDIAVSGRHGTGATADAILDRAAATALERIRDRQESVLSDEEMDEAAERIAAAALRYEMIRHHPHTDIEIDPNEIVALEGETGAYLLYAYARLAAILRHAEESGIAPETGTPYDAGLLAAPQEAGLIEVLARFPSTVQTAAETLEVHLLAAYAHELATACHQFYDHCPILNAIPPVQPPLLHARLGLAASAAQVLRRACAILGLETVEQL